MIWGMPSLNLVPCMTIWGMTSLNPVPCMTIWGTTSLNLVLCILIIFSKISDTLLQSSFSRAWRTRESCTVPSCRTCCCCWKRKSELRYYEHRERERTSGEWCRLPSSSQLSLVCGGCFSAVCCRTCCGCVGKLEYGHDFSLTAATLDAVPPHALPETARWMCDDWCTCCCCWKLTSLQFQKLPSWRVHQRGISPRQQQEDKKTASTEQEDKKTASIEGQSTTISDTCDSKGLARTGQPAC